MESYWRPIETAPKDGTLVLLLLHDPIPEPGRDDLRRFDGVPFVGRHHGAGFGWSFPVGMGGFTDRWIKGWMPIPPPPGEDA